MFEVAGRMLGVQAHPEFGAPYADALLQSRVARIGEAEVAAARRSLVSTAQGERLESDVMAGWIHNFLRR
jgi:hypothetical protein